MKRFTVGNVIKTKEGIIGIVYKTRDDGYIDMISFDSNNCFIGIQDKTYDEDVYCDCGDIDCQYCDTGKSYKITRYGADSAELIATTVKDWIIKSATKNFGF